jgi:hypothetical protein
VSICTTPNRSSFDGEMYQMLHVDQFERLHTDTSPSFRHRKCLIANIRKSPRELLIRLSIGGIHVIACVRCCFQRGAGAAFGRIAAYSDPHIVQCYPRAWHSDVGSRTSIMWVLLCALIQTMRDARAERLSPAGWWSCKQDIDAENSEENR